MKAEGKSFNIYNNDRPKVLLLGNGINRAFGDKSWDEFLAAIHDKELYPSDQDKYILPMGLKASMLSGGHLQEKLRDYNKTQKKTYSCNQEKLLDLLIDIAELPFDYILTTNYSYEIEIALSRKNIITDEDLIKSMSYTEGKGAEKRYLLHTYNEIMTQKGPKQIWHIHGEYRKPDSMVLGQYYYGNLLYKYNEILKEKISLYIRNIKHKKPQKINSWVEAFILGDVYIVGQGMDFAETDLWWLFEKKFVQDKSVAGKTFFYDPEIQSNPNCIYNKNVSCKEKYGYIDENECKILLMESYNVQYKNLNFTAFDNESFINFYKRVIEDMENIMNMQNRLR